MAEVDSRMKDLMDIGISHDKSLEGLVNDLAATCTDVPRLKGLARFLGYGGMDEYELAARLYDRCLDVHLTALTTARTLWRDKAASIVAKALKVSTTANALKNDSKPVEEICRAQLEAADNLQWHGSEGHERKKPTCCAPEIVEAWEAQCEAWRKAGALFRETRDRAASKLGSVTQIPVCHALCGNQRHRAGVASMAWRFDFPTGHAQGGRVARGLDPRGQGRRLGRGLRPVFRRAAEARQGPGRHAPRHAWTREVSWPRSG